VVVQEVKQIAVAGFCLSATSVGLRALGVGGVGKWVPRHDEFEETCLQVKRREIIKENAK
jgi:hypothetical protein